MSGRPTACSASETEESGKQLCSTWHVLGINIEAMFFMPRPRVWMEVGKKVDRSRLLGCAGRFCVILSLAICLAGCGERSQDLEERVTQLQKELNRTQDELRSTKQALNATNEELARLKAASNSASATAPVAGKRCRGKTRFRRCHFWKFDRRWPAASRQFDGLRPIDRWRFNGRIAAARPFRLTKTLQQTRGAVLPESVRSKLAEAAREARAIEPS